MLRRLQQHGIIQSMSRAGTPHDNAVMESFFGWFKEELNLDFHYKQSCDIFDVVRQTVDYFNFRRPVAKLQYKSPVQFRLDRGFMKIIVFSVFFLLTTSLSRWYFLCGQSPTVLAASKDAFYCLPFARGSLLVTNCYQTEFMYVR